MRERPTTKRGTRSMSRSNPNNVVPRTVSMVEDSKEEDPNQIGKGQRKGRLFNVFRGD